LRLSRLCFDHTCSLTTYWQTGTPSPLAAKVACTDYSVAKDGKLVA